MKLTHALKAKNRLAGEIARLQDILQRENARRSDSVSTVSRKEVYAQILSLSERLGELKAKIAKANTGIYAKLERMSELKAHLAFLAGLSKREGEEIVFVGRDREKLSYTWDSFITQQKYDETVVEFQRKIEDLQDEVDDFNFRTTIE